MRTITILALLLLLGCAPTLTELSASPPTLTYANTRPYQDTYRCLVTNLGWSNADQEIYSDRKYAEIILIGRQGFDPTPRATRRIVITDTAVTLQGEPDGLYAPRPVIEACLKP